MSIEFRSVIDLMLEAHLGVSANARQQGLPGVTPNHEPIAGLFI